ncbi:hypothetical protein KVT40_003112 [Elsinoe batatas]|uniref:Ribosome biogenesis protein Urb1 n=1 Tax=Elsinoe batatas TaxID=2601811 RepID=A0A8K0L5A6_9PEZI|nr:hypothetical protein KVT40_003112 [Elsinoe batatas]
MGGKRAREAGEVERSRKAPKRHENTEEILPVPVESARQLRTLLHFRQDDDIALRTGQASLKAFLESIANVKADDDPDRVNKLAILKDFIEHEQFDLHQTWSFAAQTDNERLVIAVTSNLALLLRTLSGLLDFRDQGLALAKSLLQREQLKLFSRGLSSESHKEALISPCLRMLTEIVSFDGGVLAGQVFRFQDFTFNSKFLDRNLRLYRSGGDENRRKPSVRSNTVRYILSHLKSLNIDDRISMLSIRTVFRNLFENIRHDPPELVQDILKIIEVSVLKQQDVPRKLKSSMLSERALISLVDASRSLPEGSPVDAAIRYFLLKVCTDSDLGIHLPSSWYPPSKDNSAGDIDRPHSGTDSADIRNIILSKFLPYLRAHSDLQERALLLSTFEATPELVADYLRQTVVKLSLQPKLTNTWLGYASLMYAIVQLPVPDFFGLSSYRGFPPEMDVILENIVPAPLTADVLTRCLNQNSALITFFSLRLLVVALQKASEIYGKLKAAALEFNSYENILASFEYVVAKRLPVIKDVAATYREVVKYDDQRMSQEAAAHALSLYQCVMPEEVIGEVDAAGPLAAVLEALQTPDLSVDDRSLVELQLAHLLELARSSSNMLWWQRQGRMVFSPFVTIVKILVESPTSATSGTVVDLLSTISAEDGVLQSSTELSAMDALLASLEPSKHWKPNLEVWRFLDDCVGRLHKKPIKYLDDLDNIASTDSTVARGPPSSLLALVLVEQVPFTSRLAESDRDTVLNWCARFAKALEKIGEDERVVSTLSKLIKAQKFNSSKAKLRDLRPRLDLTSNINGTAAGTLNGGKEIATNAQSDKGLHILFDPPPQESDKHPSLTRYKRHDLEEVVQGEVLDSLILCLCSDYPEIRRQGTTAIQYTMERLQASNLESKDQLWLLLGDLVETAAFASEERPLSYLAGSFATASRKVILDPTSFMFPLVNKYLLKDPYWEVRKLPDYFLRKTLLEPPGEDDKFWPQIEWILAFMVDGVRKAEDALIFRHRNVLERILALVHSPTVTTKAVTLILQLVHRLCTVGGSTRLITNAGIDAWISSLARIPRAVSSETREELKAVVEQNADADRVAQWRGTGGMVKVNGGT